MISAVVASFKISPAVFVICLSTIFVFLTGISVSNSPGIAATLTLSFLTGVDSPSNANLSLSNPGRWLGWGVTVAGWLIIPTTVAALLGFGERRIRREQDLELELWRIAERMNLTRADQQRFVNQVLEKKDEWLPTKK